MRKLIKITFSIIFTCFLFLGLPTVIFAFEGAASSDENNTPTIESGYHIYIDDEADLLTPDEENRLQSIMKPITTYGNVCFISIDSNPYHSVEDFAANYGYSRFGNDSYTLVIIDMDYRKICVYSEGDIYKTITTAYANTITDNIYSYASDGEYYECAYHAFDQINTLLEGKSIAQPMKYISNALLAMVLALLINYFIVMRASRSIKASDAQVLNGIYTNVDVKNPSIEFLNQTRRYSPQSSGSSGARSGGRSSGGGSRGGGGSHSF